MDATEWDRRYEGAELLWTAEPNRFLVAEVEGMPPGRALDLACGEGRNAVWLARQGWRVTAVDFSPVGIDKGRRLAAHHGVDVDWVVADLTAWEPPAAAFDLVAWLYLHLPAETRQATLARAATALAPGGTLLVVGHHLDNLEHGYGGPPVPEILLVPEVIAGEIDALGGMHVERAEMVERAVDTPDGPRTALDALIRARRPA